MSHSDLYSTPSKLLASHTNTGGQLRIGKLIQRIEKFRNWLAKRMKNPGTYWVREINICDCDPNTSSLVSRYFLNTSLSLLMVMGLPDVAAFRLSRRNSSRSFFFRIFTSFSCATGAPFPAAHSLSLKRQKCLG